MHILHTIRPSGIISPQTTQLFSFSITAFSIVEFFLLFIFVISGLFLFTASPNPLFYPGFLGFLCFPFFPLHSLTPPGIPVFNPPATLRTYVLRSLISRYSYPPESASYLRTTLTDLPVLVLLPGLARSVPAYYAH